MDQINIHKYQPGDELLIPLAPNTFVVFRVAHVESTRATTTVKAETLDGRSWIKMYLEEGGRGIEYRGVGNDRT